ncbi:MAG: acetylglutamate kinase [Candidatus Omnitrophota bacterium]|jgi:acetylglutamate kinase|nr:MAG: acetylglutamate kinase [Candidatus Omnitrophota bacterium]
MSDRDLFSKHLIEALPYIRYFHAKTIVIKYGGAAMAEESLKQEFCRDIVLMDYVGMRPIVVHGGGPQVTSLMKRLGKDTKFVDGLRVTDKETIDIAEMVLTGGVGKDIVARMNLEGGRAVGLSGKDANLIRAKKFLPRSQADPTQAIDIGYVGEVESIDPLVLNTLEAGGFIPVISSVGMGSDGHAYNINADTVAGEIARALKAERLVLLTDTPGVMEKKEDIHSLFTSLSAGEAQNLIVSGIAAGGMIPKIQACLRALGGGVKKTHIIDGRLPHSVLLELFTDTGIGTQIYPDA